MDRRGTEDLKERGVKEIDVWVSDGNQAMLNAITKQFPTSARQSCVVHKMDNVLSYIPHKQQDQVKPSCGLCSIRRIGKQLIKP